MGQLDGKVCIVTGGAGSIGLASVQLLLAEGAKVALVDVDEARLAKAAAALDPDRVITIAADVAKTGQVKTYVERTVVTWGKIDVFFSNAGIGCGKPRPRGFQILRENPLDGDLKKFNAQIFSQNACIVPGGFGIIRRRHRNPDDILGA